MEFDFSKISSKISNNELYTIYQSNDERNIEYNSFDIRYIQASRKLYIEKEYKILKDYVDYHTKDTFNNFILLLNSDDLTVIKFFIEERLVEDNYYFNHPLINSYIENVCDRHVVEKFIFHHFLTRYVNQEDSLEDINIILYLSIYFNIDFNENFEDKNRLFYYKRRTNKDKIYKKYIKNELVYTAIKNLSSIDKIE